MCVCVCVCVFECGVDLKLAVEMGECIYMVACTCVFAVTFSDSNWSDECTNMAVNVNEYVLASITLQI